MKNKKTLKQRIIREMVISDKDKLIRQIHREYPSFYPFSIIFIVEKIIKKYCDKCSRKKCWHKYRPALKDNYSEIDCFEKEEIKNDK